MEEKNKRVKSRPRGPVGGMMMLDKADDFKGTVKKLLKYLNAYKVGILLVILFAIGSSVFSIIGPKILGNATTEISTGLISKLTGGDGINFDKIKNILLNLLMLYT